MSKNKENYKKYFLNENYFDEIDSPDKSYWLGMLLSDGCVYKNKICLELELNDKNHVEKFRQSIGSNHIITEHFKESGYSKNGSWTARFSFSNKHMSDRLKEIGIIERKTYYAKPLNCIPKKFEKDFWRGMVDGDGHVKVHQRFRKETNTITNNFSTINLCGTKDICEGFKNFCLNYINSKSNVIKDSRKNCFRYTLSHRNSIIITTLLYGGADIYMERKYKEALIVMDKSRLMIPVEKSFGFNYPNLLNEWDYEYNKDIDPMKIASTNMKKYGWVCQKCGNKWVSPIRSRTDGSGCKCKNKKRWSDEEIYLLKKMYDKNDKNTLVNQFNRSIMSIRIKAKEIGLIKPKKNRKHIGVRINANNQYESRIWIKCTPINLGTYDNLHDAMKIRELADKMKDNRVINIDEYKNLRKKFKGSLLTNV